MWWLRSHEQMEEPNTPEVLTVKIKSLKIKPISILNSKTVLG